MLAERAAIWLIGMLTGVIIAVMLGLGPEAPDGAPAFDTQDYTCDDSAHAEP